MTRVSIIIPNHNKHDFIAETVSSVQNQTNEDWEIIFVDDHSTDQSLTRAQTLAKADSRIRVYENLSRAHGGAAARNYGLALARGEYVMFLDSDDVIAPNCISERVSKLESTRADFVVFPMGTFLQRVGDRKSIWSPRQGDALIRFLQHQIPWSVMSPMFKKTFVESVGGFDERYPRLQDVEFHTRCLMAKNCTFATFPDSPPDCYYRVSAERTRKAPGVQLGEFVEGVGLYLDSFSAPASELGPRYSKALSVTLFRGFERITQSGREQAIDQPSLSQLQTSLLQRTYARSLPPWKRRLLAHYQSLAYRFQPPKGTGLVVRALLQC